MRFTACAVLCLLLLIPAAFAQTDRGTITGTVSDPTGAMIPNAPIEAKNIETGAAYKVEASATGNYTIANLPAGPYQVAVSASGFKQYVRTGITVLVAQTLRVDIKLEVGSITETVNVSADAPLLKTESGEMSHNVTSDTMDNLPMLSTAGGMRDAYAAMNLLPGAFQGTAPGAIFGTMRINGMPGGSLALRIEGQDATQTAWTQAAGMSQPSVDSIEETAIQTSNFAAEFGQAGGGVFNMTVRSGTNGFHGSAFNYFRNEAFNAYPPYIKTDSKPRDRRNDFGFTAGGPVFLPKLYDGRSKSFFFFSYEQNRNNTSVNAWRTVPTDAYRAGDFSNPALYTGKQLGTDVLGRPIMDGAIYDPRTTRSVVVGGNTYTVRDPFMGCDNNHPNVICQDSSKAAYYALDPVALKLQGYIPRATNSAVLSNLNVTYPNETVNTIYALKMDHNLSSKMKISGYWSLNDNHVPFPDGFAPPITSARDLFETSHTVRINFDYTITPTMLLHLGAGYMHFVFQDPVPGFGSYDNLKDLGLPGTHAPVYPSMFNLYQTQGGGMADTTNQGNAMGPVAQQTQWQQKPTGNVSLNWVRGNHTYKFGGEVRVEGYPSVDTTPGNGWFYFNGAQTALPYLNATAYSGGNLGFPYASFLLGNVSNGQIGVQNSFHIGKHSLAFFAQDSWKVTPKLTIDYGLRYDYQTYLKEGYGRIPNFGYDTPNPAYNNIPGAVIFEGRGTGKCNCDFAENYPYAFGPRLGIAYQFMNKTVLRAGIGVSYGQTASLEMWSLRFGSDVYYGPTTNFGGAITQLKNGPPVTPVWPNYDPGQAPVSPGATFMTSFDRHAGYPPRQVMWSVGIQRELTKDLSLEVAYVGNRGVWWNAGGTLTDPNRVTPAILKAHNMDLGNSDDQTALLSQFSTLTATQLSKYNLKLPYPAFQGTVSQSIRPYPHFGSIYVLWSPIGNTWYDSMQVKLTKRFSHGLDLTANYTFQKELTIGAETQDTAFEINPAVINLNNLRDNKVISGMSIPHRFVIAGTYLTPGIASLPKWTSSVVKDWRLGWFLTFQSGMPILAPMAFNYPNPSSLLNLCAPMSVLGGCNTSPFFNAPASYQTRVQGQPLFVTDINSHYDPATATVLNNSAWAAPPAGQFGTGSAYYNDYRYRRTPTENLSIERVFRFKEGVALNIRMELMNAFNRTRIPAPFSSMNIGTFGTTTSYLNAVGQRTGQLVARLMF